LIKYYANVENKSITVTYLRPNNVKVYKIFSRYNFYICGVINYHVGKTAQAQNHQEKTVHEKPFGYPE
jgi:hypothetical protein